MVGLKVHYVMFIRDFYFQVERNCNLQGKSNFQHYGEVGSFVRKDDYI